MSLKKARRCLIDGLQSIFEIVKNNKFVFTNEQQSLLQNMRICVR